MKRISIILTTPNLLFYQHDGKIQVENLMYKDHDISIYPPFSTQLPGYFPYPKLQVNRIPNFKGKVKIIEPIVLPIFNEQGEFDGLSGSLNIKPKGKIQIANAYRIDMVSANNEIARGTAEKILNIILKTIKSITRQWWIGGLFGSNFNYYTFESDQYGNLLSNSFKSHSNSFMNVSSIGIRAMKSIDWIQAINKLRNQKQIPLFISLWFDSINLMASRDLYDAMLTLAIAAESAKETFFKTIYPSGMSYKRGRILEGWELPYHLDESLKKVKGVSYRELHQDKWDDINDLWDFRGKLAHGEKPIIFKKGQQIELTSQIYFNTLNSVDHLFGFLRSWGLDWFDGT